MVASETKRVTTLGEKSLQNSFVEQLPGDTVTENYVRQVSGAAYSLVEPTPPWKDDQSKMMGKENTASPETIRMAGWSQACADLLELPEEDRNNPEVAAILAGAKVVPGSKPYAHCYGGHQFGNWAGQLGDGRAINLGAVVNSKGQKWELQLKGAGRTPFSRFADGRAVMRSSVREFLCSEAMHFLGVPTTRALSLVATGAGVVRDQFYDGRAQIEPGAVVCRVAQTFLRLGSFELPASRGDMELLKKIADYAIAENYPQFEEVTDDFEAEENRYVLMLREIVKRTASMVASWQAVGFVHGVCNTDNFSITGLTIDYGPYAFMDGYSPKYTPNTTDIPGRRYCYANQPMIGKWNMVQVAQALLPLTGYLPAKAEIERYDEIFSEEINCRFQAKLGLAHRQPDDEELLNELLMLMAVDEVDFTNTWRSLCAITTELKDTDDLETALSPLKLELKKVSDPEQRTKWGEWVRKYAVRIGEDLKDGRDQESRSAEMKRANPKYILRNYLAQVAIEKAERGDYAEVEKLLEVLQRPYEDQPENDLYAAEAPEWANRPGVCVNSCSS